MFAQEFDAATFQRNFGNTLKNPYDVRIAVRQAKKYVLDYNASRQISDLGSPINWIDNVSQLRRMARSPHQKIWIEFNSRARRERLLEMTEYTSSKLVPPEEVFPREAWLVEYHPNHPSCHRATVIMDLDDPSLDGTTDARRHNKIQVMPFSWTWNTDDVNHLPWGVALLVSMRDEDILLGRSEKFKIRENIAELAIGLMGYKDEYIHLTGGYGKPDNTGKVYDKLAGEFAGELRYIMAFLASLSSEKVIDRSNVRTSPSKHASGRLLPAYEFTEVRITVPKKRRLASYLAQHGESGIKKRQHDVDGFWRLYQHGSGPFCIEHHTWESSGLPNKQYCANCPAWRTWVMEHERGDPLLGRVEHIKRVVT